MTNVGGSDVQEFSLETIVKLFVESVTTGDQDAVEEFLADVDVASSNAVANELLDGLEAMTVILFVFEMSIHCLLRIRVEKKKKKRRSNGQEAGSEHDLRDQEALDSKIEDLSISQLV